MKRASAQMSIVAAMLAAGLLLGCSSPERELRKAKEAGTIEALDAFLQRHPEGPLAEQAQDAKEQLAFDAAKTGNSIAAYEQFLKAYPKGRLASAAQAGIEELRFAEAQAAGTIEAYDTFIRQHRRSPLVQKASRALDALLPATPLIMSTTATSTEPSLCTVRSEVAIIHRSGTMSKDVPPAVEPGMMNCAGTIGASGIEIEKFEQPDPNHSVLNVRSFSTAGWAECGGGTCTVRFSVMGQETVVTATYK